MKENYGFTGTIFAFGLYGAFGLSFLFLLGTWLLAPTMFNNGQYGMSFMFTFPFGWLVGSLIGLARASTYKFGRCIAARSLITRLQSTVQLRRTFE